MRPLFALLSALPLLGGLFWMQAPPAPVPPQPKRQPDIFFLPTPQDAVDRMLQLAQVGPKDVVYDLGCGDGRIVITAAKKFGAHGVGIDIDPDRIRDSNENAVKAGIADRVKFREEDLFTADIHDATVVTLYLLNSLNTKLMPKLRHDLRPGARIVSYTFNMGSDWKPDKDIDLGGNHAYLWIVPDPAKVGAPLAAPTVERWK